jgi:hypothetical protein
MMVDPIIKNIKWNPFIKIKAHLPMSPPHRGGDKGVVEIELV